MTIKKKTSWKKRVAALLCTGVLCFGLMGVITACSTADSPDTKSAEATSAPQQAETPSTRTFTDSLGREVEIPVEITAIAPSGHTAQQVLLTIAPEKMVTLSQDLTDDQLKYFKDDLASLPVTGAAFGAKGDMNKEAVAAAAPQIVIDTGEPKKGLAEDLDALQSQLGIPVVFINTPLDDYSTAYTLLGELLGEEERGKKLADYCNGAYAEVAAVMKDIPDEERVNVAYLMGDTGLNAIAQGSYQGSIIDLCATNVVVLEEVSGSGLGQEISLEQLTLWNPEMIVFGANSIYPTVGDDAAWSGIDAITNKEYYEVPAEPWTWLNNPPTVNQVLGLQWFARICYPEAFEDDLQEVVNEYYKTFYNYDLSDADYQELTQYAQPK